MYLDDIKTAARISHDNLDGEIGRLEEYARAELIRAGVPYTFAEGENELIKQAIITWALAELSTDKAHDRLIESWNYQVDNLRKHNWKAVDESV